MSRLRTIPLAAVILAWASALLAAPAVPPTAPPPRAVTPKAPLPHLPGERDLTNPDIGIDPILPDKLDVERLPDAIVPDPLNPKGPGGLQPIPAPPGLDLLPGLPGAGLKLGVADDPFAELTKGAFAGRNSAARAKLVKLNGGSEESERAVALGLAWLAKQQKSDGSWVFDGESKRESAAATGFALLAFLGAGESHKDAKGKYKATVKKGLDFLIKNSAKGGKFAGAETMYGQGIATLALVEAYGLSRDPALKVPAQAAINYILKAQAPNGSWGYVAGNIGDTSIVGWQVQAMFGAKQAGLVVEPRTIKGAIGFLDKAGSGKAKAVYGYTDNAGAAPGTTLTAVGLWCRTAIDNWGPETPGLTEGTEGLLKRPPTKNQINLYHFHYATMVCKAAGGDAWQTWNEGPKGADGKRKGGLRDPLVSEQKLDGDDAGSWNSDSVWIGRSCGRVGTTALAVVNLEAYYRYVAVEKNNAKKDVNPKK